MQTKENGKIGRTAVKPYAWVVLVIGFVSSVAAPLCMFKVSTVLTTLSEIYNLSTAVAGMMVSIFALTGFILAIPASTIFQKLGLKWTCVVAMAFMIAGSFLGVMASSGGVLLFSRFIEGAGMGLVSVAVPAGLSMWFPEERRGLAMGIWNNYMPVGNMLAFSLVPLVVAHGSYKSAWWLTIAYAAVCLVLCLVFMRAPRANETLSENGKTDEQSHTENVTIKKALSNRNIWLVSLVALCFGFCINILSTYYPTFVTQTGIMSSGDASMILSVQNIMGMVCSLLAGYVLGKMRNRKLLLTVSLFVLAILYMLIFRINSMPLVWIWMVAYSPVSSFAPTTLFTIAPEVMRSSKEAAYGMGMVTLGQNLGMFIGAPIFGAIAEASSWPTAGLLLIPICIVGALLSMVLKLTNR